MSGYAAVARPCPSPIRVCYRERTLYYYSLHQRVVACDCELPLLSSAPATSEPDMIMRLAEVRTAPPDAKPWFRNESIVIDRTEAGDVLIRFADQTQFLVSANGRVIELLSHPAHYTGGDIAIYALGIVTAIALHLQRAVLLHASAVVLAGKAVLFAGPSGSGKSTIAAILHREGYTVLADDVTEIDGDLARPSLPAIRLWPDTLDALYGSSTAFPDRAPSWDKKVISGGDAGPARPVGAVLFIDPALRDEGPRLQRLEARAGWEQLLSCVFTVRLPDNSMAPVIFDTTASLANSVPMYMFTPPLLESSKELGAWLEAALAGPSQ